MSKCRSCGSKGAYLSFTGFEDECRSPKCRFYSGRWARETDRGEATRPGPTRYYASACVQDLDGLRLKSTGKPPVFHEGDFYDDERGSVWRWTKGEWELIQSPQIPLIFP